MGRPCVHYTCRHCSCHLTVTTHAWAVLDVVTTGHLHTRKLSWLPSSGASQQNPLGVLVNMWLLGFTPDSCLKTSMERLGLCRSGPACREPLCPSQLPSSLIPAAPSTRQGWLRGASHFTLSCHGPVSRFGLCLTKTGTSLKPPVLEAIPGPGSALGGWCRLWAPLPMVMFILESRPCVMGSLSDSSTRLGEGLLGALWFSQVNETQPVCLERPSCTRTFLALGEGVTSSPTGGPLRNESSHLGAQEGKDGFILAQVERGWAVLGSEEPAMQSPALWWR